jgi:hypothetical protein
MCVIKTNFVLCFAYKDTDHLFHLKNNDGTFSTYELKRTTPLLEVSILCCFFVFLENNF